jgi:hypothetical protein
MFAFTSSIHLHMVIPMYGVNFILDNPLQQCFPNDDPRNHGVPQEKSIITQKIENLNISIMNYT